MTPLWSNPAAYRGSGPPSSMLLSGVSPRPTGPRPTGGPPSAAPLWPERLLRCSSRRATSLKSAPDEDFTLITHNALQCDMKLESKQRKHASSVINILSTET